MSTIDTIYFKGREIIMTKFTVVHQATNLDTVAPIGTRVMVRHDGANKYDKHALRVKLERTGQDIGFIGANATVPFTENNTVLFDIMTKSGNMEDYACTVVDHQELMIGSNKKLKRMCLVIEPVAVVKGDIVEDVSGVKFEFSVKGTTRKYKAKKDIIGGLIDGETPLVALKMDGDQIIAMFGEEPAGEVDPNSPDYDLAVKVITTLGQVAATTRSPQNATYKVDFEIDEETMTFIKTGKKVLTLQDVKDEKSSFIPIKRLDAIQNYLGEAGLKNKQIMAVMETYVEYPKDVQSRIPEPTVFFKDNFGGVRKTVIYTNKGKHLRLVGEKGTGKNLLTSVLAWVYQRPLFELSMNSQTDKMDLMGSKTFTTTVDAEGKETTQIGFQKEALVEAMELGGILNLDEVNVADPAVLVMLHSIVDDRGSIEVPGYGRVTAHKNFNIILTMNKNYIGTNSLNEATSDRFTPIIFPNNHSIAEMLKERVKGAKAADIQTADRVYKSIMTLVQDGTLSMDCVTVRGFIDALEVADDLGLKEALEDSVANRVEDDEYRETVISIIDDILG